MLFRDQAGSVWELLGEATQPGGTLTVVLRSQTGSLVTVPKSQFPPAASSSYTLLAGSSTSQIVDVTREMLQAIRHQTTVRFVALPVFIATTGALAGVWIDGKGRIAGVDELIFILGLLVSVMFAVYDIVLSRNLIILWQKTKNPDLPIEWQRLYSHRMGEDIRSTWLWLVRICLYLPYAIGAGFWASLLPDSDLLPISSGWTGSTILLLLLVFAISSWRSAHNT